MALIEMVKRPGASGFGYGSTAEDVTRGLDLHGKNILVTGSSSGLGAETARVLSMRGARVFVTGRTTASAKQVADKLGAGATPLACELSDPASVEACVAAVKADGAKLDAILCNAGIMALPTLQTTYGCELQFFTNHIGHFILVTGLLDQLAEDGRVVMTSSDAHRGAPKGGIDFDNLAGERGYSGWRFYGQSKIANIFFAKELARRFEGQKRTANALHPGVIRTNLARHMNAVTNLALKAAEHVFLKSAAQGAATQTYVAVHPDAARISGRYFADCNVTKPRSDAENMATAAKLWEVSERIVSEIASGKRTK